MTYVYPNTSKKVLNNISLTINKGDKIGLYGASGSGKSTLLNLLGLLDSPTSGTIFFEEREISQLTSLEKAKLRNSSFGFIFQGFNLLKKHSVLENVMLPLLYSKVQRGKAAGSAKEILDATGLGSLSDRLPSQLSGGQQQRVAICRALVVKPTVILADEPTGNLDSTNELEIMDLLTDLNKRNNQTFVIVTHSDYVGGRTNRIINMKDGKVV